MYIKYDFSLSLISFKNIIYKFLLALTGLLIVLFSQSCDGKTTNEKLAEQLNKEYGIYVNEFYDDEIKEFGYGFEIKPSMDFSKLKEAMSLINRFDYICIHLDNSLYTDEKLSDILSLLDKSKLSAIFFNNTAFGHRSSQRCTTLGEMPKLVCINLSSTKIDDAFLSCLKNAPNLKLLQLNCTEITDAGLSNLKYTKDLDLLGLTRTNITDAGLLNLTACKNISEIRIGKNKLITDIGVANIYDRVNPAIISLSETSITDESMRIISQSKETMIIDADTTKITDVGISHLQKMKQLENLHLDGTLITDGCLPYFNNMEKLKNLYIQNTRITNKIFSVLSNPSLRFLVIDYDVTSTTDKAILDEFIKRNPKCSVHRYYYPKSPSDLPPTP